MRGRFSADEIGFFQKYVLFDAFSEFYHNLSGNDFWSLLLEQEVQLGRKEMVFIIEKQYEQGVVAWLRQAAHIAHTVLKEIEPPENMVAEIDREASSFLKEMVR